MFSHQNNAANTSLSGPLDMPELSIHQISDLFFLLLLCVWSACFVFRKLCMFALCTALLFKTLFSLLGPLFKIAIFFSLQTFVSVLPVVSKLIERHVKAVLETYLQMNAPISEKQWGFMCGRSTMSALIRVVDDWQRALDQGNEVCAVFIDISKASDTV